MVLKIIEIIFPVLIISLLGYFYAKKTNIDMNGAIKLNMDIFLPILVFYSISEKLPSITVLGTFSIGAVIVILGSGIILYPVAKILKVNPRSFLPPMMLGNSVNLGLPLTLFAFGEEAVSVPLVVFALGVKLAFVDFSHLKIGIIGAILCPLSGILIALGVISVFDYTPMQVSLLILFAALPPAAMNAIMAEYYKHDASLVTSIVAVSTVFSVFFIPIVLYFLL